jgi:hypothetical protein
MYSHAVLNSFSIALFEACFSGHGPCGLFSKLTTKPTKSSKPTEKKQIFDC